MFTVLPSFTTLPNSNCSNDRFPAGNRSSRFHEGGKAIEKEIGGVGEVFFRAFGQPPREWTTSEAGPPLVRR